MKDKVRSLLSSSRTEEKLIVKTESCLPDNSDKKYTKKVDKRQRLFARSRPPTSRVTTSLSHSPPASFVYSLFKTLSGGRLSVMSTARNLIRSCSGSLTVQHFARRTVANSPRIQFLAVGSRRFYSGDTEPSGEKSGGESKDASSPKNEPELSKQLEEVADLKVCIFFRDRWHFAVDICPVDSATVSPGRLY